MCVYVENTTLVVVGIIAWIFDCILLQSNDFFHGFWYGDSALFPPEAGRWVVETAICIVQIVILNILVDFRTMELVHNCSLRLLKLLFCNELKDPTWFWSDNRGIVKITSGSHAFLHWLNPSIYPILSSFAVYFFKRRAIRNPYLLFVLTALEPIVFSLVIRGH